jgi:hypothetical protein
MEAWYKLSLKTVFRHPSKKACMARTLIGVPLAAVLATLICIAAFTPAAARVDCSKKNIDCLNKCNVMPDDKYLNGPKFWCLRKCEYAAKTCDIYGKWINPEGNNPLPPPSKSGVIHRPPISGGTEHPPSGVGKTVGIRPPNSSGTQKGSGGTNIIPQHGGGQQQH